MLLSQRHFCLSGLLLVLMQASSSVFAACPASPVGDYGSSLFLTIRDCTIFGPDPGESCVLQGAAYNPATLGFSERCLDSSHDEFIDGANAGASGEDLGFVMGSVVYNGPAALPSVSLAAVTTTHSRNGATQETWQTYTYSGAGPSVLPIVADLTFDYGGGAPSADSYGGSLFYVSLTVVDANLVTAADLANNPQGHFFATCGDEAFFGLPPGSIIAAAQFYPEGDPAAPVTLEASKRCDDGTDIIVAPGDSFIVATANQAFGDRGGFADSSNTLKVKFDENTPPEVLINLVDSIQPACIDCGPELLVTSAEVKVGGPNNCLKLNGKGVIPASIFGSAELDVSEIRLDSSLTMDGMQVRQNNSGLLCHQANSNSDSHPDLKCKYEDDPQSWAGNGIEIVFQAKLTDGTPVEAVAEKCVDH